METLIDALEAVQMSPPGMCAWSPEVLEDDGDWHVAFYVRETSERIAEIPDNPQVLFRGASIVLDGVVTVVVMIGVTQPSLTVYETWFNLNEENRDTLELLLKQHRCFVHFVGDSLEVERSVKFGNTMLPFWKQVLSQIDGRDWTEEEFDAAKDRICDRYSSQKLWEALNANDRRRSS